MIFSVSALAQQIDVVNAPPIYTHEPIEVSVSGVPDRNSGSTQRFWITLEKADARVGSWAQWYWVDGGGGTFEFRNPGTGSYELRLHDHWSDRSNNWETVFSRAPVEVIYTTPSVAAIEILAPNPSPIYSPFEARISGLDPKLKYWVTVVPQDTRDGGWDAWVDIEGVEVGTVRFDGQEPGEYELRVHDYRSGQGILARESLVVNWTVGPDTHAPACPGIYDGTPAKRVCSCGDVSRTSVWGTDIYTTGSDPCSAAIHTGAIRNSVSGDAPEIILIEAAPGKASYESSLRNGIQSSSSGRWHASFLVSNPLSESVVPEQPSDVVFGVPIDPPASAEGGVGGVGQPDLPIGIHPQSTEPVGPESPFQLLELLDPNTQNCRGRLGIACGNRLSDPLAARNVPEVTYPCDVEGQICITAMMSLGSIKHDVCCDEQVAAGRNGHACFADDLPDEDEACKAEWIQAVLDLEKAKRFPHTWRYIVGSTGSSPDDKWWYQVVPDDVEVNQEDPEGDSVFCESGEVINKNGVWVCGSTASNNWAAGVWYGQVSQPSSPNPYAVRIHIQLDDIGSPTGSSYYPGLQCGGNLKIAKIEVDTLTFAETITENNRQCLSGSVELRRRDNDSIGWRWYQPSGRYGATATLTRPD